MHTPCAAEQAAAPRGAPRPSVNVPVVSPPPISLASRPSFSGQDLPATSPAAPQHDTQPRLHAVWHAAQAMGPAATVGIRTRARRFIVVRTSNECDGVSGDDGGQRSIGSEFGVKSLTAGRGAGAHRVSSRERRGVDQAIEV